MARTTATNFSGGLQFPYATAATDLFKKEDIQTLAQAVDQHDHSTGKGLALPSGSITLAKLAANSVDSSKIVDGTIDTVDLKDGSVTSVKIADGTIVAADIADATITSAKLASNAATLATGVAGVSSSPQTTSASQVDLTDMSLAPTLAGSSIVVVTFTGTFGCDSTSGVVVVYLNLDGIDQGEIGRAQSPTVNLGMTVAGTWPLSGIAAGAHTFKIRWLTTAGTATSQGVTRRLTLVEYRK